MRMGVFTLHASNIKGFAFEFGLVLCGLGPRHDCPVLFLGDDILPAAAT